MKKIIIKGLLVIIWMSIVFYFSNQPASISEKSSVAVSETILKSTHIINLIEKSKQEDVIEQFDRVLRKIAHYTIYLIGGMFIYTFVNAYNLKEKYKIIISSIVGIIYAITDEIHQYFIPGRACMWQDVCIDSLGVLTGISIILILIILMQRLSIGKAKKIKEENNNE